MKILLTAWALGQPSGIPMFTKDLALALHARGADVAVYTLRPGGVSAAIAAAGIPVVTSLDRVPFQPDVIHGQDQPLFIRAMRHFPAAGALGVTHDATSTIDAPFFHPRIGRYIAVDDRCRRRIEAVADIPRERIDVVFNAVDLDRFRPRAALPAVPRRALIFSNYAHAGSHMLPVMQACAAAGLDVDVVGSGVGKLVTDPEAILGNYDIVFAKARCALEALATGTAVVLCDFSGLGPMVASHNVVALRRMNFGAGVLIQPLSPDAIRRAIADYDPQDAMRVSATIRQESGIEASAARWLEVYRAAIAESARNVAKGDDLELRALERKWRQFYRIAPLASVVATVRAVPVIGETLYSAAARLWHTRY